MATLEIYCPTCGANPGEPCRSVAPRTIRNRAGVRPKVIKKLHAEREPKCYLEPFSPHTACGDVGNDDTDSWRDVTCPKCLAKQDALALNRAHYYGKEFEANPGSSMREYLDDCAYNLGVDTFAELPADKKSALRKAFDDGRAIERSHNVRMQRR